VKANATETQRNLKAYPLWVKSAGSATGQSRLLYPQLGTSGR